MPTDAHLPVYQPGVCNIGPAEIRRRRSSGYLGLAISAILLGLLLAYRANSLWRLTLFLPVTTAATGFLQAYYHFCAGFGMRGLFNVAKSVGQTDTVIEAEFRKKDKQKSLRIFGQAVLVGVVVAFLAYIL